MSFRRTALAQLAVLTLVLVACGHETTSPGGSELSGPLTVSAAASLTGSFETVGAGFEAANPGVTVDFNFDSSGTLSTQILEGAPVDVFASANQSNMDKIADDDQIDGDDVVFATNRLIIVTQPGNPEGIATLADLADVGIVSLCSEDAPCGTFADEALTAAAVEIPEGNVTRGQNVKATLAAVTEGDAVAALVYVTDAQAAGDRVDTVVIPDGQNVIATYPIAVMAGSGNTDVAQAFVAYVQSAEGQAVLEAAGFQPPS
ncbi:MAG: molybdate ABC transporter substrate-binding protein [Aquihabitans sp.]